MKAFRLSCLVTLLAGSCATWSNAFANSQSDWEQLNPAVQKILRPLEKKWSQLSEEQKQRYLRGARVWLNMRPGERRLARKRLRAWRSMPQERRQRLIRRYQIFRNLPPEERRRLRRIRAWFRSLPPHRRQQIRQHWQNMSADEKRQLLIHLRQRQIMRENRWRGRMHRDSEE